jgi:hypothetical protein
MLRKFQDSKGSVAKKNFGRDLKGLGTKAK